jgi:hypothetical protein
MTGDQSEQIYFKLCSDHLSVEAIPKTRMKVNFAKLRDKPPREYELLMWTPHFAVLRSEGGQEITLRQDGRMIVRKSGSENIARQAAVDMIGVVLRDFRA